MSRTLASYDDIQAGEFISNVVGSISISSAGETTIEVRNTGTTTWMPVAGTITDDTKVLDLMQQDIKFLTVGTGTSIAFGSKTFHTNKE